LSKEQSGPTQESHTPSLQRNVVALGLVQVSSYVLPLITIPYITRKLGVEAYGKVAFAQVLAAYLILMVDYGFSWSTSRKIAAHRSDRSFISRTFVATFAAQWSLLLAAIAFGLIVVLSLERLRIDLWLYVAAFTSVIGTALFPIWFFQGLERLQAVATLQVISQLVAVISIFFLVKEPKDAIWVLVSGGAGSMLGGIGALWWMQRIRLIDWVWPGWRAVGGELSEGAGMFGSRVSISLYTTLVPIFLGLVAGPVALAYFNMADKLRRAAQSLITPLSLALFPRMSHLVAKQDGSAYALIKRSFYAIILIAGSASLGLWFLADWIVWVMGGDDFKAAATVLRWFAPVPLIIGLSNLMGVQIMLPQQMSRAFNRALALAAIASFLIIWPLSERYAASGAAATILIAEAVVTLVMSFVLWRHGLLNPKKWNKQ
jgi:PST family polysaccharide transporter